MPREQYLGTIATAPGFVGQKGCPVSALLQIYTCNGLLPEYEGPAKLLVPAADDLYNRL